MRPVPGATRPDRRPRRACTAPRARGPRGGSGFTLSAQPERLGMPQAFLPGWREPSLLGRQETLDGSLKRLVRLSPGYLRPFDL